jgi:hypothetical protein
MNPTVYRVTLNYTRQELLALFDFARRADVECGGRYDARSGALIVWSHGWQHVATWEESDMLGAFYVNWLTDWFWQIDCAEGFGLEDLLVELGTLELGALGYLQHGSPLSGRAP